MKEWVLFERDNGLESGVRSVGDAEWTTVNRMKNGAVRGEKRFES